MSVKQSELLSAYIINGGIMGRLLAVLAVVTVLSSHLYAQSVSLKLGTMYDYSLWNARWHPIDVEGTFLQPVSENISLTTSASYVLRKNQDMNFNASRLQQACALCCCTGWSLRISAENMVN